MHSSRMRTARAVTVGWGGCLPGGCLPGGGGVCPGVSCDLCHHALDVTCMLSQHQLNVNTSATAYIV